jgi:hypothetical protein
VNAIEFFRASFFKKKTSNIQNTVNYTEIVRTQDAKSGEADGEVFVAENIHGRQKLQKNCEMR